MLVPLAGCIVVGCGRVGCNCSGAVVVLGGKLGGGGLYCRAAMSCCACSTLVTILDLVIRFRSSTHLSLFLWFSILVFNPAKMSSISVASGLSGSFSSSVYGSTSSSSYPRRFLNFCLLYLGSLLALCAAPTINLNLLSKVSANFFKRAS